MPSFRIKTLLCLIRVIASLHPILFPYIMHIRMYVCMAVKKNGTNGNRASWLQSGNEEQCADVHLW